MTYSRSPHLTVALALAVLAAVGWTYSQTNGSTTVAAAVLVAVFVGLTRSYRASTRAVIQPSRTTFNDAETWFRRVCRDARVPIPLVLGDYPTKHGHEYIVLITGWCENEGRPMTVGAWFGYAALLKDTAGLGCRKVECYPDADHGGRGRIEFHGVRFGFVDPDDPTTELPDQPLTCQAKACTATPTVHVHLAGAVEHTWALCARHAKDYPTTTLADHPWTDACLTGCDLGADESNEERTPDPEPLSPLVILHPDPREGSGGGWAAPDPGAIQPAPIGRPAGAADGTRGGLLWDTLRAASGPCRRGTLAEASGLSPTTVDRMLAAWADLGLVAKVGPLWEFAPRYINSVSIPRNGREEDPGE